MLPIKSYVFYNPKTGIINNSIINGPVNNTITPLVMCVQRALLVYLEQRHIPINVNIKNEIPATKLNNVRNILPEEYSLKI